MYIEQGRVRPAHVAPGGDEAICGLVGTGAFLGEEVLGGRAKRRQTAIAMIATQMLAIARAPIADRFIAHILARHRHLEADLADQLLHSAEQRVARARIVHATADRTGTLPLPSVVGIAVVAGGVALLVGGMRKHAQAPAILKRDRTGAW